MSKNYRVLALVFIILSGILSGCASRPGEFKKFQSPDDLSSSKGFTKKLIKGHNFWITTYGKITKPNESCVFYIEGDSSARLDDPTPQNFMLLNLALLDKRPNIYYISRLCQYTPMHLNPKCNKQYWSQLRYSKESVDELSSVISQLKTSKPFDLVGFSGGGAMAILIAAHKDQIGEVRSILTIAGNLDIQGFVKYHGMHMNQLAGSLNPMDFTDSVKNIPQLHVCGGKDSVVPSKIAANFVNKVNTKCVQMKIFKDVEHNYYWSKHWNYILGLDISCNSISN